MNLTELKTFLTQQEKLEVELPTGELVPSHFHLTEIGQISKRYIDCGGTFRFEEVISLQLWTADDYEHRLTPQKFLSIIEMAEEKLSIGNLELEVEYQGNTIQKFGLQSKANKLVLTTTLTDCLAKDKCGVPEVKTKVNLKDLPMSSNACTPGGNCC